MNQIDASCQGLGRAQGSITWCSVCGPAEDVGVQPGHHGRAVIHIDGQHAFVVQADSVQIALPTQCLVSKAGPTATSSAGDAPAPRRSGRVSIVTAAIGAIGVVVAALVAGAFTIWPK
ncbi:hypothetical protein [Dactylosporangium sp. NPDC051541]|uniref:hypothetical protein n=1 Tax=Dactylosporangium sp. NPDC051541 TaxID=3363977 RepID=UPI003793812D